MSLLTALVLVLLVAGIVVTAAPKIPGGVFLSLSGVYLYWWASGFSEPSTSVLVILTLLGGTTLASKLLRPVIVKKVGGTPMLTTTLAGTVGAVAFFVWGTAGLVFGTFVTVFVLEYLRRGDLLGSLVASFVVVLATFTSKLAKILVTVVFLLVMGAVILL